MPEGKDSKKPAYTKPIKLKGFNESQNREDYVRLQEAGRIPPDEFLEEHDPYREERLRKVGESIARKRGFI